MSYRRLAGIAAFVGSATFALLEVAQTLFRSDHGFGAPMSDYAIGEYGFVQTVAFAALGLASLALCAALSPPNPLASRWRAGRLLLATWSVGVLLAATFPVDAGRPTVAGQIHGVASGLSFIAVTAAMFVLAKAFAGVFSWAPLSGPSTKLARVASGAFLVAATTHGTLAFGIAHRVFVGAVTAWLMLTGLRVWSMGRSAKDYGTNIERLRGVLAELNRGNLDELASLLHPRVCWYPVPGRGLCVCRHRDEVLATMGHHLDNGFPLEDVELLEAGEEVLVRFPAPDHLLLPPGTWLVNVFRFDAGKVVRIEDRLESEEAAGAVG